MSFETWLGDQEPKFIELLRAVYEIEQKAGKLTPLGVSVTINTVTPEPIPISTSEITKLKRHLKDRDPFKHE